MQKLAHEAHNLKTDVRFVDPLPSLLVSQNKLVEETGKFPSLNLKRRKMGPVFRSSFGVERGKELMAGMLNVVLKFGGHCKIWLERTLFQRLVNSNSNLINSIGMNASLGGSDIN